MIDYREKIATIIYYDCTDCPYVNEGSCFEPKSCKLTSDKADQILSTVISEGIVCDRCRGHGRPNKVTYNLDTGYTVNGRSCVKCDNTGWEVPPVTIDDAIKEKLK